LTVAKRCTSVYNCNNKYLAAPENSLLCKAVEITTCQITERVD